MKIFGKFTGKHQWRNAILVKMQVQAKGWEWKISQRRFDVVFHAICCCNRKMLKIHLTVRTYYFWEFPIFQIFWLLSPNIAAFFAVPAFLLPWFSLCVSHALFYIFISFYIFCGVDVDCVFLFYFFSDAGFIGKSFRNFSICLFFIVHSFFF